MKTEGDLKNPGPKAVTRRELLKKTVQGAVVLGALHIGLADLAADTPLVKKRIDALVSRGVADPNFRQQLETNPAAALGKQPEQLTPEDREVVSKALQEIKRTKSVGEVGGPCGIAKSTTAPTRQ
ncbi:MAG: hypothetical protein HY911_07590 [Desulfobacterales bacterium]|nr:hypothetical protein [Desulfobacterales bacterium]